MYTIRYTIIYIACDAGKFCENNALKKFLLSKRFGYTLMCLCARASPAICKLIDFNFTNCVAGSISSNLYKKRTL